MNNLENIKLYFVNNLIGRLARLYIYENLKLYKSVL